MRSPLIMFFPHATSNSCWLWLCSFSFEKLSFCFEPQFGVSKRRSRLWCAFVHFILRASLVLLNPGIVACRGHYRSWTLFCRSDLHRWSCDRSGAQWHEIKYSNHPQLETQQRIREPSSIAIILGVAIIQPEIKCTHLQSSHSRHLESERCEARSWHTKGSHQ